MKVKIKTILVFLNKTSQNLIKFPASSPYTITNAARRKEAKRCLLKLDEEFNKHCIVEEFLLKSRSQCTWSKKEATNAAKKKNFFKTQQYQYNFGYISGYLKFKSN